MHNSFMHRAAFQQSLRPQNLSGACACHDPHLLQRTAATADRHWQLAPVCLSCWPWLLRLLQRWHLLLRTLLQAGMRLYMHQLLAQARYFTLKQFNVLYSLQCLKPVFLVPQQHIALHTREQQPCAS